MVSWLLRFASGACFLVAALVAGNVFDLGAANAWAFGGVAALVWSGLPSSLPPAPRRPRQAA